MRVILFVALFFSAQFCAASQDPIALYLNWYSDPTTTMTINWVTDPDDAADAVRYKELHGLSWKNLKGMHHSLPHEHPAIVHTVELQGLKPDTEYQFQIGSINASAIYKFKTLPKILTTPLRFVVGGDVFHDSVEDLEKMNIQTAKTSPAFALQGGDLAYSRKKVDSWLTWMKVWTKTMVTPSGLLIPIIPALGNHDIEKHGEEPADAPIYTCLFRYPNRLPYYTFDAGDYLALTVLDSGHTSAVDGKQLEWLKNSLKQRVHYKHKFALYHVPAYPSHRRFESKKSAVIREHWVPLFDKYGLHAAFENHDHCYKRSYPLKNNVKNSKGVLYLGDGAWGVAEPREPKTKSEDTWYLAKTAAKQHFILVTLKPNSRTFDAIDHKGKRFDSCENSTP